MPFFSQMCHSKARLDGKTVIVTGCNTGIGKETVLDFYKRGARIILACRDVTKAEEAKSDIEKLTSTKMNLGEMIVMKLDLNSLKSVRDFAEKVLKQEQQINILVNNAGVMMCPQGKTEDGFETQFGTNHLAHFLLTLLLLPRIIKSAPARIVTVSSVAHSMGGSINLDDPFYEKTKYAPWEVYCRSKLANVLFSVELSRKLKEHGITNVKCYSLHPGGINTDLQRHFDSAIFRGFGTLWSYTGAYLMKTPLQGAQTTIYCSLDEKCANETGLYYNECAVAEPINFAKDEKLAKDLWEFSLKSVNFQGQDPFKSQ